MNGRLDEKPAVAIALAAGAAVEFGVCFATGKPEAWDSSLYWAAGYPLLIAVAGALGFATSDRPWRWGVLPILAQALTMTIRSGGGALLIVGLLMFAVMSLPCIAAAKIGARFRGPAEAA